MDTKTICLALLSQGDTTGYEIKKAFEEGQFSYFQDVSFGSIYPALNKALAEGLVSVTETPQQNRPVKKVYSISTAGEAALVEALVKPAAPDRVTSDFLFKILFSDLLTAENIGTLIDDRLTVLGSKIERMNSFCGADYSALGSRQVFVFGFGLAIHQAMRDFIEHNRGALEDDLSLPKHAAD